MESKIIYPSIKAWFERNEMTFEGMARGRGVTGTGIKYFLRGQRGGTKLTIDAVLDATGMTYEEAFKKGKVNNQ